jgi:hypothetical protein
MGRPSGKKRDEGRGPKGAATAARCGGQDILVQAALSLHSRVRGGEGGAGCSQEQARLGPLRIITCFQRPFGLSVEAGAIGPFGPGPLYADVFLLRVLLCEGGVRADGVGKVDTGHAGTVVWARGEHEEGGPRPGGGLRA